MEILWVWLDSAPPVRMRDSVRMPAVVVSVWAGALELAAVAAVGVVVERGGPGVAAVAAVEVAAGPLDVVVGAAVDHLTGNSQLSGTGGGEANSHRIRDRYPLP